MDLESQSLSSPRGHKPLPDIDKSPLTTESAISFNDNDDYSCQSDSQRGGKRNWGASLDSSTPNSKKRKRIEERNAVVFYNIPPQADRHILKDFVERMFQEMHGTRAAIVKCLCISCTSVRHSFLVTFDCPEHAEIAISLNGVELMGNTIYVNAYNSDETSVFKTKKSRICLNHVLGDCEYGDKCFLAHGIHDLRIYSNTVLSEKRTVYITQIPCRYPHLLNTVKKRFEFHGISPFITAFYHRAEKGDALVEFADIRHAKKAFEILNGIRISTFEMQVHPFKPAYQSVFVEYFKKHDSRSTRSDDNHDEYEIAVESPEKSASMDNGGPGDFLSTKHDNRELQSPLKPSDDNEYVLRDNHTIYINKFPFNYPPEHLLNTIKKKFDSCGMSASFAACHVRRDKGDAVVEFVDIEHAKKAYDILEGIYISRFQVKVRPLGPKYRSFWVKCITEESSRTCAASESPSKPTRSEDTPRMNTPESVHVTPEKQASNEVQTSAPRTQESPFAVGSEDDKQELQRLRDKILQLQEQTSDYKRLLDKAHDDVQYYRERFKTAERSYSKDYQTMQDKLEDLKRDKDRLVREMDHLGK